MAINNTGSEHLGGQPVFVTGATGFIGSRLVPALLEAGAKVTALLRSRHGMRALEAMGVRVITAALDDSAALQTALRGQSVLFHLAYDVRASAASNLAAFDTLRGAAETAGVGRIVYASSIVTYKGWPHQDLTEDSPRAPAGDASYQHAKVTMEQALMQGNCPAAILQPTLVYGPGSMLWTDQMTDWLAAGTVVLPEPEGVCNAVFVDDLVQTMLRAAQLENLGQERFIISGAAPVTWSDFLLGYAGIIGRGTVRHVPLSTLEARLPSENVTEKPDSPPLAARVSATARMWIGRKRFEKLVRALKPRRPQHGDIFPDRHMLDLYSARGRCRIDHARARLGYAPSYTLEAGLNATRPYLETRFGK